MNAIRQEVRSTPHLVANFQEVRPTPNDSWKHIFDYVAIVADRFAENTYVAPAMFVFVGD